MRSNSRNILDYVGNTPLVELSKMSPNPAVHIFAKLEGHNPTGSIKDRVAKYLVEEAEKNGVLKPGDTIIEASTGNTALALALISKQKGYKIKIRNFRRLYLLSKTGKIHKLTSSRIFPRGLLLLYHGESPAKSDRCSIFVACLLR